MLRILFISKILPIPPVIGGNQRTNLLMRALREVAEVDAIGLVRHDIPKDTWVDLEKAWGFLGVFPAPLHSDRAPWRHIRPLAPKLVQRLAHNLGRRTLDYRSDPVTVERVKAATAGRSYDLAVGRYLLPTLQSGVADGLKTILDIDDLDTQVYATRLNAPWETAASRWVIRRHLRQLERLLPSCLSRMQHLWLSNQTDLPLVQHHRNVSVLPNIPFAFADRVPSPQPHPESDGRTVMVVGSMNHGPNARGIDRLVTQVWPRVRQRCPNAVLRIVGSHTSDKQRRRWGAENGVEVAGFIPQLEEAYRKACFTVSPIYEGGGTKIKVIESLAYNRACVTTSHSLCGYEHILADGLAVRVADNDTEMADVIATLLTHPDEARRLAANGRQVVVEHFSFERFRSEVHQTIESTLNRYENSRLAGAS